MNSYERVMSVYEGKQPDCLPVIPIVREWCSRRAGIEFTDELESVEKHVYSQSYCQSEFGYDVVWDLSGCHSESEAMGSRLKITTGHAPSVEKPAVGDYAADLPKLRLFDPHQVPRLSMILEGIRRLKARYHSEVPVIGYIQAPWRHACMLRGPETAMRDIFKQKDKLAELCEVALASLIPYAVALASAGVDIVQVSDPMSSGDAISKKHWEAWGFPLTRRLVDVLRRCGVKTFLHVCGDTTDRLESLAATGVDCLSLDEAVDFEKARRILGPAYTLMGNVSTSLVAFGTPAEVKEATKEVIRKAGRDGHLIVSAGCLISDVSPPENVRAMIEAAREARL